MFLAMLSKLSVGKAFLRIHYPRFSCVVASGAFRSIDVVWIWNHGGEILCHISDDRYTTQNTRSEDSGAYSGGECEAFVPADFVESVLLPAVEHEVGHIVAAAHFGAIPIGIGIGLIPECSQSFHFQAVYGWEGWSTETRCIVSAAGPAADLIYRGAVNEAGASGDLNDIEALTDLRSLEPYLLKAQEILSKYNNEIVWTAAQLRSH